MAFLILGLFLAFLLIVNTPIGFALGICSLLQLILKGSYSLIVAPQKIYNGIDSFPLLAIPFFLLAASLMTEGGLTPRIIAIFNAMFGWIRGSLAITNIGVSMFFAGVSGSAVADTSSVGAVLIPAMNDEGYEPPFSAAVTASSSICGPIIPPSIPLIIYGVVARVSIFGLFLGGAIPGLILGLSLIAIAYVISRIRKYHKYHEFSFSEVFETLKNGIWALIMPIILVGGIIGGVFTVTELAAVTAVYAFVVGFFVYREIRLSRLLDIFVRVSIDSAVIMIIVGLSNIFAFSLTIEHIPEAFSAFITSITSNRIVLLVLINIIVLIAGMFIDSTPATIILGPILLPLAQSLGISPLHFGVILVFNLMMGLLTPPVCLCLMISAKIARCGLWPAMRESIPFFLVMVVILFLLTFFPPLAEY
ncbi:MAG: TRAP transporter large permease, partial [Deltaproteobacteria bacterium]|nr:TRAP transporter large permease [Deltaproteobacteria bacterium]